MSFHGFLCDSMPTSLVGSRRFLLYDHLSVVSRSFYPSIMYIMSQSPPSYLRIDTLSPSASTGYGPGEQQSTQIRSSFIFFPVCGVRFNCELCDPVLRLRKRLFKVGMEATISKATSFISSLAKQTYSESNRTLFPIGVEGNRGNRRENIGLGGKVTGRRRHCTEAGSCRHCGKTGHKEDSCWKKYPELIPNRYKLEEDEAPPTPPKKVLSVGKKRLC